MSNVPEEHDIKKDADINYVRLKELRTYGFFSFALWPCIVLITVVVSLYYVISGTLTRSGERFRKAFDILHWTIFPYYLIIVARKENISSMVIAILLLLPLMFATIMGPLFLGPQDDYGMEYGSPKPPVFYRLFGDSGAGLFGTNGDGVGIDQLIFMGAGNIYFTSLLAIVFVLAVGLWLGKLTFYRRAEFNIMGFVELVETIPILFVLLIVLAIFGWWEEGVKEYGGAVHALWNTFLTVVVGIGIGSGFLPRIIRLIRERIKTFVSENFVDGAKAHGIDQNRILWFHIIKKNCMGDIIIAVTQIWAGVILIGINLDYLISIFPLFGAKNYNGWAQMLLTPEARKAVLFLKDLQLNEWWLYSFPLFFIVTTITGFYLFGYSLKTFYSRNKNLIVSADAFEATRFDYMVEGMVSRIGI